MVNRFSFFAGMIDGSFNNSSLILSYHIFSLSCAALHCGNKTLEHWTQNDLFSVDSELVKVILQFSFKNVVVELKVPLNI